MLNPDYLGFIAWTHHIRAEVVSSMGRRYPTNRYGYADCRPEKELVLAILVNAFYDYLRPCIPAGLKSHQPDELVATVRREARSWLFAEDDPEEPFTASWCAETIGITSWRSRRKLILKNLKACLTSNQGVASFRGKPKAA